jgi:hypothetical protein
MKPFYIIGLALGLVFPIHAQDSEPDSGPTPEQIQKAIDEFNRSRKEKPNEVTVVLPPPSEPAPPRAIAVEEEPVVEDSDPKKPVLVSGKPPEVIPLEVTPTDVEPIKEADVVKPEEIIVENTPKPQTVRVESIKAGTGEIDPKNIEIKSSFPTKALVNPPNGWKLETSHEAPPFSRQVEIEPGTFITLEISPHILSPAADGAEVFSIIEPGYKYEKGYQQEQTVANILETSITQLDADSMKMGNALSELHRLLASLPKPEIPVSNTNPPNNP